MNLIEIGEVMHFARSGRLIVRLNPSCSFSKIGQSLFDINGTKLGKIIELIGSVKSPIASILPEDNETIAISGTKVFEPHSASKNRLGRRRNEFSSPHRKLYKGKRN